VIFAFSNAAPELDAVDDDTDLEDVEMEAERWEDPDSMVCGNGDVDAEVLLPASSRSLVPTPSILSFFPPLRISLSGSLPRLRRSLERAFFASLASSPPGPAAFLPWPFSWDFLGSESVADAGPVNEIPPEWGAKESRLPERHKSAEPARTRVAMVVATRTVLSCRTA
jgi:hypothetical protein